MSTRTIPIERSRTGLPCLWEQGGGSTNTGWVQIVATADGSPKRPIYIRRRGSLSNGEHALFVVREGDVVVEADHHRQDFCVEIARISAIRDEEAILEPVAVFDEGEWVPELPEALKPAVEAACEKAVCYHCREPHFIRMENEE